MHHRKVNSVDTNNRPSEDDRGGRKRTDSFFDVFSRLTTPQSQLVRSSLASEDLESVLSYEAETQSKYATLLTLTNRLSIGCPFGPRSRSGRTFLNVCRGREIVAWLLADPGSGYSSEDEAVTGMQKAIFFGLLRRVSAQDNLLNVAGSKNEFKNDNSIYTVVHSRTGAFRLLCTVEEVELTRRKKGDYYVRLSCGGSRVSTKVIMKSSKPVFDEVFEISPTDVSCSQLIITLMQYNGYTSDGFIGEGRVALCKVEEGIGKGYEVEIRRESHRREGGVEAKVRTGVS